MKIILKAVYLAINNCIPLVNFHGSTKVAREVCQENCLLHKTYNLNEIVLLTKAILHEMIKSAFKLL